MLKIGDFSKLCRVTIKALRYYDEIGLLKPDFIGENGYRLYAPRQLGVASNIVALKEMGFSLDEINHLIKDKPDFTEILALMDKRKSQILDCMNADRQRLAKVEDYINKQERFAMSNVNLKELPEVIVASMRTIIPNYAALNEVVPAMGEKMRKHGAACREPFYCFNIYHDGEYKEKDVDVEICEAVVKACPDADGVTYKTIEAVKTAACVFHKGPYTAIGSAYAEVFKWIEQNGYRVVGNPRESYIDGCWNKDDPADWLTEIQVPVAGQ